MLRFLFGVHLSLLSLSSCIVRVSSGSRKFSFLKGCNLNARTLGAPWKQTHCLSLDCTKTSAWFCNKRLFYTKSLSGCCWSTSESTSWEKHYSYLVLCLNARKMSDTFAIIWFIKTVTCHKKDVTPGVNTGLSAA